MAREDPQLKLRLSERLKDRVAKAAKEANRSVNAEIVQTLEFHYPEPITIEDTVKDIQQNVALLRRFKANATLLQLADTLDELIEEIGRSDEGSPEDRKAAAEHSWNTLKRRLIDRDDF